MAKKKDQPTPKNPVYVTVKLLKEEHAKLRAVAAELDRDLADVLSEIVHAPLDKMWKGVLEQMNERAKRGT